MIIFDSSYLVVLLHPNPAPAKDRENKPVTKFQERVAYLAATMDASNDTIGIPTPAMAEVLVRSGAARAKYVSVLSDRLKFQIIPFDSRAAIEASDLIAAVKTNKEKWETWAKVKFDIQIVAIAKAEAATLIYSDDRDIENYARRFKIRVMRICDLPLPPPPPDETIPIQEVLMGGQGELPLAPPSMPASDPPVPIDVTVQEKSDGKDTAKTEQETTNPAQLRADDSGGTRNEAGEEKVEISKAEEEKHRP